MCFVELQVVVFNCCILSEFTYILIIMMEISKVPIRRYKMLNKHNRTHITYIELEPAINLTSTHTCVHAHTYKHIVQTDRDEGQCCLTEIFGEEISVLTLCF